MTEQEIDTLTGRDLDAAVAERVMGIRRSDICPKGFSRDTDAGLPRVNTSLRYSDGTDMNATWAVVDKMRNANLCTDIISEPGWPFTARVYTLYGEPPNVEAIGDTAATAICRAALKAVQKGSGE